MTTLDDLNAALGEAIADYEVDNETSADDVCGHQGCGRR